MYNVWLGYMKGELVPQYLQIGNGKKNQYVHNPKSAFLISCILGGVFEILLGPYGFSQL